VPGEPAASITAGEQTRHQGPQEPLRIHCDVGCTLPNHRLTPNTQTSQENDNDHATSQRYPHDTRGRSTVQPRWLDRGVSDACSHRHQWLWKLQLPGISVPSYQAGYTSGTSGSAHNFLVETGTGTNGPAVAADSACGVAFTAAQILTPSLTETDYQHGCHDALSDHPVK
jgi:hypothetical protein